MNINKKTLIWSIILSLLTAYIFPGRASDEFAFEYGYPISFLTMYERSLSASHHLLFSTSLNLINLLLNILLIYFIIYMLVKITKKLYSK